MDRSEVDPTAFTVESQFESVVDNTLLPHALTHARIGQQSYRSRLEHACKNGGFDLFAAASFDYDRIDSLQLERMGKQRACRPYSDDANLYARVSLR